MGGTRGFATMRQAEPTSHPIAILAMGRAAHPGRPEYPVTCAAHTTSHGDDKQPEGQNAGFRLKDQSQQKSRVPR